MQSSILGRYTISEKTQHEFVCLSMLSLRLSLALASSSLSVFAPVKCDQMLELNVAQNFQTVAKIVGKAAFTLKVTFSQ